jgi:uncharacterized membrane protein
MVRAALFYALSLLYVSAAITGRINILRLETFFLNFFVSFHRLFKIFVPVQIQISNPEQASL